jgi:hypothetical protein
MKFVLIGALAVASTLSCAADAPDEAAAALKRLDHRVTVAEKQARASAASLRAVRTEAAAATALLESVQASLATQAKELNALRASQTTVGAKVDDIAQLGEVRSAELAGTVASRTFVFAAILGLAFAVLAGGYFFIRKRRAQRDGDLTTQLDYVRATTRQSEERAAIADSVVAGQLTEVVKKLMEAQAMPSTGEATTTTEVDHNLPLKLADEIHRMRKRLETLPQETKGLTPLKKSLERLEAELANYGYELVDHTGRPYSENLSLKARFVPSDHLGPEERVISKVVSPQVNHKGVMVRMADVEVSIGS